MAHSHSHLREVHAGRKRVSHILKGHKSGGKVHSDEAADKKLFGKLIKQHDAKVHGKASGGRLDKFARGGKTKSKGKHGTHINIAVVAPHGRASDPSAAPAAPGVLPPPGGGPRPPMMPPPGMGGPPGMPPGMPPKPPGMMKRGGKVPMTAGAISGEGRKQKIKAYGLKPKKAG